MIGTSVSISEITVQDFARERENGEPFELIDVRESDELAIAGITGARHIPLAQIAQSLPDIPQDRPVYVLCHHGGRSERAVRYLAANGRPNAINIVGGIDAWAAQIDTSLTRY